MSTLARKDGSLLSAALVGALVMVALPARAQNLLTNPNFDQDLSGWFTTAAGSPLRSATFDPAHDANGSSTSGSALLNTHDNNSASHTICQCVNGAVNPGVAFDFGGSAGFLSGMSTTFDLAFFRVYVFPDADCGREFYANTSIASYFSAALGSPSRWNQLRGEFALPAGFSGNSMLFCGVLQSIDPSETANVDSVFLTRATLGGCVLDDSSLCLDHGRFRVTATYQTGGSVGSAHALRQQDLGGYLWFFSANNPELSVKVLNGCGVNQRFWVFASGLTDVGVILTVTDTATGAAKSYANPVGRPFTPIQDTSALDTCP